MPPSGVAEQCQHASLDAAAPSFNPRFEQGNHMVSPGMLLLLSLPARGYYMHTSRSARCLSVPSPTRSRMFPTSADLKCDRNPGTPDFGCGGGTGRGVPSSTSPNAAFLHR